MIKSIEWCGESIRFLDQTQLPALEQYVETADLSVLLDAIISLKVRGAPLLGIAAAYGVLLGVLPHRTGSPEAVTAAFDQSAQRIAATRPTAKNLFWALERMRGVVRQTMESRPERIFQALVHEAVKIHDEDREMCAAIGKHGATLITENAKIITHCNTGALATGGIGTAFGILTTAHAQGKKIFVYADETRPLLQGARLTMWELHKSGIPSALITDNAAAWTMRSKKIDLVITGADRIAANGDTANKIGTYNLAVLAKEHRIPMYIAAPSSTVDLSLRNGSEIPIEERSAAEIVGRTGMASAPEGAAVFAPAFDVTPHELIRAIITEKGVLRPPYEQSLAGRMES